MRLSFSSQGLPAIPLHPVRTPESRAFVLLALLLLPAAAAGQATGLQVADTSSPRATLRSFIEAANEIGAVVKTQRYLDRDKLVAPGSRVIDCLDKSQLPTFAREDRAAEVAVAIKEVLDRVELPPWDEVPDSAAIEEAGGMEQLSRWRVPGTRLFIARVEVGAEKHEYLFSPGTVDRAVAYYESVASQPYRTDGPPTTPDLYLWYLSSPGHPVIARIVDLAPEWMRLGRSMGMAYWQWPALLLVLLAGMAAIALLYRWHLKIAPKARARGVLRYALTGLLPIAAMLIPVLVQHAAYHYLTLRGLPLYVVSFGANAATILAAIVVAFVTCNRLAELIIASPSINAQGLDAQLIRIGCKLLSLSLAVIIFVVGGQYVGIPVGTLLADKPFSVGERIVFKQYDGVVEDIGLRSTRLRLLNGHQVTIPNDELARTDVENVGRRRHIRRVADLRLPLTTPRAKVEAALTTVRDAIADHEGMHEDFPPRVGLLDLGQDGVVIRVLYWFHPPDYWAYLAFSERFNLSVMRSLEEQGIALAAPLRLANASVDNAPAPIEVRLSENA